MSTPAWASLSDERRGMLLGVTAYLFWGFAALYWAQTWPVDPRDLLAHRVVWAVPFVFACLVVAGRLGAALSIFARPRTLGVMALAALFGGTNWLIFLWAISNERATEASLGYFLLPIVNVLIGLLVFRETIDRAQKIGIGFAVVAMLIQVWHYGGLPLVALALPLSFGLYGAIRKKVPVESLEGLFIETVLLSPAALAWMYLQDGAGLGRHGAGVDLFLLGAGAFTAIPLITYVAASRLLPLTALGLVFYIGPTAQLLVALVAFGEPFDIIQAAAFGLVWVGLAIVTADNVRRTRKLKGAAAPGG
jgi:chloramphenicol-sensitive protein RarD